MAKVFNTPEIDSAVKLMYYCSKVLGLIPFMRIANTSSFESNISLPSLTWTIFLTLLYSIMHIDNLMYEINTYDRNSVYETVGIPVKFYSACCYPIAVLVLWCNRRSLIKVIGELIELDNALRPKNSKKLIFVIIQLCIAFTLIASSTVQYWLKASGYTNTFLAIVPVVFSIQVVEFQFSNLIRLLTQYFLAINSVLEVACLPVKHRDFVISTGSLRATRLLVSLHDSVCDVTVLANSVYSPILLLSVGGSFVTAVYVVYFTVARVLGFNTPEVNLAMHISLLVFSLKLFNVIQPCYTCSFEANRTPALVHSFISRTADSGIKEELQLFSLQLLHRKVQFTACGFFPLDFTLLYSPRKVIVTPCFLLLIRSFYQGTVAAPQWQERRRKQGSQALPRAHGTALCSPPYYQWSHLLYCGVFRRVHEATVPLQLHSHSSYWALMTCILTPALIDITTITSGCRRSPGDTSEGWIEMQQAPLEK